MKSLLGKVVDIKAKDHFEDGGWGLVVLEIPEDDEYHVAMFIKCSEDLHVDKTSLVFCRRDLKVRKKRRS
jgi:hypothetical protein